MSSQYSFSELSNSRLRVFKSKKAPRIINEPSSLVSTVPCLDDSFLVNFLMGATIISGGGSESFRPGSSRLDRALHQSGSTADSRRLGSIGNLEDIMNTIKVFKIDLKEYTTDTSKAPLLAKNNDDKKKRVKDLKEKLTKLQGLLRLNEYAVNDIRTKESVSLEPLKESLRDIERNKILVEDLIKKAEIELTKDNIEETVNKAIAEYEKIKKELDEGPTDTDELEDLEDEIQKFYFFIQIFNFIEGIPLSDVVKTNITGLHQMYGTLDKMISICKFGNKLIEPFMELQKRIPDFEDENFYGSPFKLDDDKKSKKEKLENLKREYNAFKTDYEATDEVLREKIKDLKKEGTSDYEDFVKNVVGSIEFEVQLVEAKKTRYTTYVEKAEQHIEFNQTDFDEYFEEQQKLYTELKNKFDNEIQGITKESEKSKKVEAFVLSREVETFKFYLRMLNRKDLLTEETTEKKETLVENVLELFKKLKTKRAELYSDEE